MTRRLMALVLLVVASQAALRVGAQGIQQSDVWGEAVEGVQLRLAVSDGPLPASTGDLLPLQVQLRNHGSMPATFIGEAITHPDIEVDGVWYVQAWAGSCCSAPLEIPPGRKSELISFRVLLPQTFALGVTPARTLDLKPGRHSIRIRNVSRGSIWVRLGSSTLVLTSNVVTIEVPAPTSATPVQSAAPPPCDAAPGRLSVRLHGAVERGDRFERTSRGWVLRLEPTEYGWVLQISTQDRPTEDLSRLTPPWHFVPNPREIKGWHFRNADDTGPNDGSVNAPGTLREFIFSPLVGRSIKYAGGDTTAVDVERVRSYGRGWLLIESYRLTPARIGGRAAFESLTFWACLTWPVG